MVENLKEEYVQSARAKKTSMSRVLVQQWRSQQPPGTFLKLDESFGRYYDIGDRKARRKTAVRKKSIQLFSAVYLQGQYCIV